MPETKVSSDKAQKEAQEAEDTGQEAREVPPLPKEMRGGQLARCDVPADWRMMVEMARFLSDAGMWPWWFHGSPANVMAIMMKARALDIPLDVAVHHIHVIDATGGDGRGGRVEPSAELIRALLEREGYGLDFPEFTDQACTILITPPGRKTREVTYTVVDAARAKLIDKTTWQKYTPDMLLARCSKRAAKLWAPGISTGLAMAGMAEELYEGDEPIAVVVSAKAKDAMRRIDREMEEDPVAEHRRLQRLWKEFGTDLLEEPADGQGTRVGDILTQLLKLAAQHIAQDSAAEADPPPAPTGTPGQAEPPAGNDTGDGHQHEAAEPAAGFESRWRMGCGCEGDTVMREGHSCQTGAATKQPASQTGEHPGDASAGQNQNGAPPRRQKLGIPNGDVRAAPPSDGQDGADAPEGDG